MSAFHNSVEGEKLALAWHKFGTYVSIVMALLSGLCVLWNLALAIIAVLSGGLVVAAIYGLIVLGFLVCALIAGGGVFWHLKAEHDHKDHLEKLADGPAVSGAVYDPRCQFKVGVNCCRLMRDHAGAHLIAEGSELHGVGKVASSAREQCESISPVLGAFCKLERGHPGNHVSLEGSTWNAIAEAPVGSSSASISSAVGGV